MQENAVCDRGNMKIAEAEEILLWANSCNPGPWSEHSRMVSKAAVANTFN